MHVIANVGLFKIGWLSCVYGAASGLALEGCILALFIVAFSIKQASNKLAELLTLALITLVGVIWESLVASQYLMVYATQSNTQPEGWALDGLVLAPYWLIVMWALFATTINQSMAWLKDKLILAAGMGAIFGPMAFIAGEKLGAVEFINESAAMMVLAVGWGVLMPLICIIAKTIDTKYEVSVSAA
jgi:hypothetical protein